MDPYFGPGPWTPGPCFVLTLSKCALVIRGEVYVAWKRKMLHDVIDENQAYIQRKKDVFIYEASNFAAG